MIEGAGKESAQGSVSAPEKREGSGRKKRVAVGKAKRPRMSGREEEEQVLKDAIDATSSTEVAVRQSDCGSGEGLGKRVRKAPKHFGTD